MKMSIQVDRINSCVSYLQRVDTKVHKNCKLCPDNVVCLEDSMWNWERTGNQLSLVP